MSYNFLGPYLGRAPCCVNPKHNDLNRGRERGRYGGRVEGRKEGKGEREKEGRKEGGRVAGIEEEKERGRE